MITPIGWAGPPSGRCPGEDLADRERAHGDQQVGQPHHPMKRAGQDPVLGDTEAPGQETPAYRKRDQPATRPVPPRGRGEQPQRHHQDDAEYHVQLKEGPGAPRPEGQAQQQGSSSADPYDGAEPTSGRAHSEPPFPPRRAELSSTPSHHDTAQCHIHDPRRGRSVTKG